MRASRSLKGILAAALWTITGGAAAAGEYRNLPAAQALIDELVAEDGLDRQSLDRLFAGIERKRPVLDAIARPAEKTATWADYRPRFLEDVRVGLGLAFWNRHEEALARAERIYGVPPEFIIAIIGVETYYGRNKGRWRIADALATLAFDYPPRSAFFREQLKQFIRLEKSAGIDIRRASGSYAGAMGFPQFMPTSYRDFAVDFDGDGHIDLLENPVDAIGSVANYFHRHGWKPGGAVAARAAVSGEGYAPVVNTGIEPKYTVAQLREAGLTVMSCIAGDVIPVEYCADPSPREKATAWQQTGAYGAEFWIGFNNYYVITRYNRSSLYALAVLQLSREIRHVRRRQQMSAAGGA